MEPIKVDLRCDIQGPVRVRYLDGNLFSMDKAANIINVDVFDNGVPVQVGGSVTAEVIRADGGTVTVSGTVSGNRASVTLPQACYAVVGAISVVIKVTEGTTITTIAAFVANVYRSSTDTVVDPGTIIQSVEDLIADIEAAVADIPVAYNASFAPAYSNSSTYAVGQYVTYDGYLWRCTNAITTAESWTSGHWTKVALAEELSDVKSAFEAATGFSVCEGWNTKKRIATTGDTLSFELSSNTSYDCIIVDCVEGEIFTLTGKSTNASYRLYCFAKADGTVIERPSSSLTWTEHKLVTPTGATKLVVNVLRETAYALYRGIVLDNELKTAETDIEYLYSTYLALSQSKATAITATQEDPKDLNDFTTPGNYKVTNGSTAGYISHMPYTIAGRLIVMTLGNTDGLVQVYISSALTKPNIYVRNKYEGSWNDWININIPRDTEPVANSVNLITSGGVYSAISAEDDKVNEIAGNIYNVEDYDWIAHARSNYPYGWRTGYFDATDGSIKSSNQYIRAYPSITCDPEVIKMIAAAPTGYAIAIFEYSEDGEFIQRYGSMNSTSDAATARVEVNTTAGYLYKFSLGRFTNTDADEYINSTFVPTIKLYQYRKDSGERVSSIPAYTANLGTAPKYRIPLNVPLGTTYYNDFTMTDGARAAITQGLCSDGKRYLYWNIAPMGENQGREVNQRIRKWDTWRNESVLLSEPGDWGHCEDTCFVPAWCPGLDNGNVDRLYTTDFDYSVEHSTGRYIHVIDANTLEEITSFPTDTLAPGEWNGVAHLTFNPERGLFCLKGGRTIDSTSYWVFFVFDMNGNLLRGARVKELGTGIGIDCDENYIYVPRYTAASGTTHVYGYVIDWELNPIARFTIDKFAWEAEGMAHIGSDIYFSYNQDYSASRKNTIEKTSIIYEMHSFTDTPPYNWPSDDGIKLSTWTSIEIEDESD